MAPTEAQRRAFEQTCNIDMTRYRWDEPTQSYVYDYLVDEAIRVERINIMLEGFLKGIEWYALLVHIERR